MIADLTYEENRLKAMQMRDEVAQVLLSGSNPWARIDFRYDWMGRRISKMYQTTNDDPAVYGTKTGPPITWSIDRCVRYVWDGWHLSLSYRANPNGAYVGPDQSFAWGPDLSSSYGGAGGAGGVGGLVAYCDDDFDTNNPTNDPDLGPMYPIYDGNGNVVRMCRFVPSAGDWDVECRTAAAYEYGPFGEALSVTGEDLGPGGGGGGGQGQRNPFRFSTEYTDAETGLVYYGYRYYSPGMGRWVSRDPIEEADGPNVLAFVRNGPTIAIDLLGEKRIIVLFDGQNFAGLGGKGSLRVNGFWRASNVRTLSHADPDDEVWNTEEDGDWFAATARKIDRLQEKAKKRCEDPYKVVLVGHSNGGDGARKTARQLNERGWFDERDVHTVDLLFLLDAVAKPWWDHNPNRSYAVSGNVRTAVNWYQRTDPLNIAGVRFQGYLISPGENKPWDWGAAVAPAIGAHSEILNDREIRVDFMKRLENVR